MNEAARFATKYLEDLLSFFGLNTEVEANLSDNTVELVVPSTHLNGFLIGQHGENLRALQHITNMALKRHGFDEVLATIDIAGYRKQRSERLAARIRQVADQVNSSGQDYTLDPMSAYDRRVVHSVVAEIDGVSSESTGEGRDRRVVIKKA